MSFITKRDRIFKADPNLNDLPARNECKLKVHASCTDSRAWSHFNSDQTEHLVDIIKRNNAFCTPKYVPTDVIVDTLMTHKNAEITRLKRKIMTLDQMLSAYDQLELDYEQKCEIAKAHDTIRAASKELDELSCLDLDMSGFTEGFDSEAFETGHSRGDEVISSAKSRGDAVTSSDIVTMTQMEAKEQGVQKIPEPIDTSEAYTNAVDPRIEDMTMEIICKDAKCNAMQNSIAVLENDICEPFCIYAHIYTALEKIFAILHQNDTYKQYLDILGAGKDTRHLTIQGRILFKMKILEKFALALMAPCYPNLQTPKDKDKDKEKEELPCHCVQIVSRVETAYALTTAEAEPPKTENKRAQLVAVIMEHDEMKEILDKDNLDEITAAGISFPLHYNIDQENVKRLADLQKSYNELMECYENLKHENDSLKVQCAKCNDLETELENMRTQLGTYESLWEEKEHYRQRSIDLDSLKDSYHKLLKDTSEVEAQLQANFELSTLNNQAMNDLLDENLLLKQKLNDATIDCESKTSTLKCKLQEAECLLGCKDLEITNLATQLQKCMESMNNYQEKTPDSSETILLLSEIQSLKDELMNLKDLLFCSEEEKQLTQEQFQEKLSLVNDLRIEIEDWKRANEELLNEKNLIENALKNAINDLEEQNMALAKKADEKDHAIKNLMNVISQKSVEINDLLDEIQTKKEENDNLMLELHDLKKNHEIIIAGLEKEMNKATNIPNHERKESQNSGVSFNLEDVGRSRDEQHNSNLKSLLNELRNENSSLQQKNNEDCCKFVLNEMKHVNETIASLQEKYRALELSHQALEIENRALSKVLSESGPLFGESSNWKTINDNLRAKPQAKQPILPNEETNYAVSEDDEEHNFRDADENVEKKIKDYLAEIAGDETESGTHSFFNNAANKDTELANLLKSYQNLVKENEDLKKQLAETKRKSESLLETAKSINKKKLQVRTLSQQIPDLESNLQGIQHILEETTNENETLKEQLISKINELNNANLALNEKVLENELLKARCGEHTPEHLPLSQDYSEENFKSLQKEKEQLEQLVSSLEKEHGKVMEQIDHYASFTEELKGLKKQLQDAINENNALKETINKQNDESNALKETINIQKDENNALKGTINKQNDENNALKETINKQNEGLDKLNKNYEKRDSEMGNLIAHNEDLEKSLQIMRNESLKTSKLPEPNFLDDLKREINQLKNEKEACHNKIRELQDLVEQNDNAIADLRNDLVEKDGRIAVMQNYINDLKGEYGSLQEKFNEGINLSGSMQGQNFEEFNGTLQEIKAYATTAHDMKNDLARLEKNKEDLERQTHNMKNDLARLEKNKEDLERQLVLCNEKNAELIQANNNGLSQINSLQNQNSLLVSELLKLDVTTGSSEAIPDEPIDLVQVKALFTRISKNFEAKRSQSQILENKMLNIQSSSQLLISKTEKAKKIAENEQQKAELERQEIETAKAQLEEQIAKDKVKINDLQQELLNQELYMGKMKEAGQEYLNQLRELKNELDKLRRMLQISNDRILELEKQLQSALDDNLELKENAKQLKESYKNMLDKMNDDLTKKSSEILNLQQTLQNIEAKNGNIMQNSDRNTNPEEIQRLNKDLLEKSPLELDLKSKEMSKLQEKLNNAVSKSKKEKNKEHNAIPEETQTQRYEDLLEKSPLEKSKEISELQEKLNNTVSKSKDKNNEHYSNPEEIQRLHKDLLKKSPLELDLKSKEMPKLQEKLNNAVSKSKEDKNNEHYSNPEEIQLLHKDLPKKSPLELDLKSKEMPKLQEKLNNAVSKSKEDKNNEHNTPKEIQRLYKNLLVKSPSELDSNSKEMSKLQEKLNNAVSKSKEDKNNEHNTNLEEIQRLYEDLLEKSQLEKDLMSKEMSKLQEKLKNAVSKSKEDKNNEHNTPKEIQRLYKNLLVKSPSELDLNSKEMSKLQEKLNNAVSKSKEDKNNEHNTDPEEIQRLLEKSQLELDSMSKEMSKLQEKLKNAVSKSKEDKSTQTIDSKPKKPEENYAKNNSRNGKSNQSHVNAPEIQELKNSVFGFSKNVPEIQIMDANTAPNMDYVRNVYSKYKQGQLSPGAINQHSYSSSNNSGSEVRLPDTNENRIDLKHNTNEIENVPSTSTKNDPNDLYVLFTNSDTEKSINLPYDESVSTNLTSNKTDQEKETKDNNKIPNKRKQGMNNRQREIDTRTHINLPPSPSNNDILDEATDRKLKKPISGRNIAFSNDSIPKSSDNIKNAKMQNHLQSARKNNKSEPLSPSKSNNMEKPKTILPKGTDSKHQRKPRPTQSERSFDRDDLSAPQQLLLNNLDTDDDKLQRKKSQGKSDPSLNKSYVDSEDFKDNSSSNNESEHKLIRVDAKELLTKPDTHAKTAKKFQNQDFRSKHTLGTIYNKPSGHTKDSTELLQRSQSLDSLTNGPLDNNKSGSNIMNLDYPLLDSQKSPQLYDKTVQVNFDSNDSYEQEIAQLKDALNVCKSDYKKKLDAVKSQYDANLKKIMNDHNQGVKSLQNLHDEIVKDLLKKYKSDVENLRTISFEAMKKSGDIATDRGSLAGGLSCFINDGLDKEPVKVPSRFNKRDIFLIKTEIELHDVKPKVKTMGPCTCSLDINVSDTIRNIFQQVDMDQRKISEQTYLKFITNKMITDGIESLDAQELVFLHYTVCRHWKSKQSVEISLKKKIDKLESELISKQRHAQNNIAELDRRVTEERRLLQEVREAVGFPQLDGSTSNNGRDESEINCYCLVYDASSGSGGAVTHSGVCETCNLDLPLTRIKKSRIDSRTSQVPSHRGIKAQYSDEQPTRLRKCCTRPHSKKTPKSPLDSPPHSFYWN